MEHEILFLRPVFTHNIWGGTKLKTEYGYDIDGEDIGECWGISAHEHGDCMIREGRFEEYTLSQLWKEHPELFGNVDFDKFPLLVKIIDARQDLSIQVHPNNDYANKHENGSFGKTECWYVLDCGEDATLVVGHNANNAEHLRDMVHSAKWKELIREIPIQKGDFIQIDPGTMHAIKGGTLIMETQQNSDITYRVYDYDRLSNGKPRELHIEKSLDVIIAPAADANNTVIHAQKITKNEFVELIKCEYYTVFKADIDESLEKEQTDPFMLVTVIEGSGTLNGRVIKKGDHFIVPYQYGNMKFEGKLQIIASTI